MPNPFTTETRIPYELAKDARSVTLTVYDITGRQVSGIAGATGKGKQSLIISGLQKGIYFYSLVVDGISSTRKMIME